MRQYRTFETALSNCPKTCARLLLFCSLLAAATLSTTAVAASEDNETRDNGPLVQTAEGPVIGFKQNGVYEFLGIPYAAPPVGPLRWRPPHPVAHWDRPLHATHFGNTCAQITEFGVFAGPASAQEDCLFLNVFTTSLATGNKPVLVWIHGGGNLDGESNDYDATKLATGGPNGTPTVVVTLNYRLGLFGFLAHPALDAEGHLHGNYGILDQQAVLHWVQRNIARFGGDPKRVTLGGQSAGAQDTGMNQISPLAAGLFHRTIYQSTPLTGIALMTVTIYPVALANGKAFAQAADCGVDASPATAACLRSLTTAQILQLEGTPGVPSGFVTGAMLDGTIMPITPIEAWSTGNFNKTPIMGGNVQDEANFGLSITEYLATPQAPLTAGQYIAGVKQTYTGPEFSGGPNYPPATVDEILAQYPPNLDNLTPQQVSNLVSSHPIGCSAVLIEQLWSKWVPVYAYEFNDEQAPYYFPPLPDFAPLAAHTIDIQFLFRNWHGSVFGVNHPANLSPAEEVLSDELVAAWTHFAAIGNPNGQGNLPWPQFTSVANKPAIFSEKPGLGTFTLGEWSRNHNCAFWTGNTVNGGILHFPPF